eukprot:363200-Chlamydomonas_euryale.AAC.4
MGRETIPLLLMPATPVATVCMEAEHPGPCEHNNMHDAATVCCVCSVGCLARAHPLWMLDTSVPTLGPLPVTLNAQLEQARLHMDIHGWTVVEAAVSSRGGLLLKRSSHPVAT